MKSVFCGFPDGFWYFGPRIRISRENLLHLFIAYLYCISLLRICIVYLYCISLLHICIAYLYCISLKPVNFGQGLDFLKCWQGKSKKQLGKSKNAREQLGNSGSMFLIQNNIIPFWGCIINIFWDSFGRVLDQFGDTCGTLLGNVWDMLFDSFGTVLRQFWHL